MTDSDRCANFTGSQAQQLVSPSTKEAVGQTAQKLTPGELEAHISSCARLMELAVIRYEEFGWAGDKEEAHRWRVLMEEGIKARSPEMVVGLEQERGLGA